MTITAVLLAGGSTPGFFDAGFGRFMVSPGFGGAAVVLAALIAFAAALIQAHATRQKTAADRQTARDKAAADARTEREQRWWQTATWVYDHATDAREEARLTVTLTLRLLDRLSRQMHTELQGEFILALTEAFSDDR